MHTEIIQLIDKTTNTVIDTKLIKGIEKAQQFVHRANNQLIIDAYRNKTEIPNHRWEILTSEVLK